MKREHTSRLFYGKYPYRILFSRSAILADLDGSGWTIHNCKAWLNDQVSDYRMYSRIRYQGRTSRRSPKTNVTILASLFLRTKSEFDSCVAKWSANIESVTEPYDPSHVDLLKDNTTIVIRDELIYRRFRYVVVFFRKWNENIEDLSEWVTTTFLERGENEPPVKWKERGWNPRLYLSEESDLVLTKLSWGEKIRNISVVHTRSELEASGKTKP